MEEYGLKNFSFEIIEECEEEELDEKEIYYIEKYKSYIEDGGYNLTRGGNGSRKLTQEKRQKRINEIISLWKKGNNIKEISKIVSIDSKDVIECLKMNCNTYSHKESRARGHKNLKRAVDCYTLWGDYVYTFSSVSAAAEHFQVRRDLISRSCKNGGTKTNLGYRFTYETEEKILEFKGNTKNKRRVDYIFKLTSLETTIFIEGKVELSKFLHKAHGSLLSNIDKCPYINGWYIEYKIL